MPINGDNIPLLRSLPAVYRNIQQKLLFCSHWEYCIGEKPYRKYCFQKIRALFFPQRWAGGWGCGCHGEKRFSKPSFRANIRHHRAAIDGTWKWVGFTRQTTRVEYQTWNELSLQAFLIPEIPFSAKIDDRYTKISQESHPIRVNDMYEMYWATNSTKHSTFWPPI